MKLTSVTEEERNMCELEITSAGDVLFNCNANGDFSACKHMDGIVSENICSDWWLKKCKSEDAQMEAMKTAGGILQKKIVDRINYRKEKEDGK